MPLLTEICNQSGFCDCFYGVTSVGLIAVLAGQCNWSGLLQSVCAIICIKINEKYGFVVSASSFNSLYNIIHFIPLQYITYFFKVS
jgi:hypothetical protein